jgi:hypothetical protein
VRRDDIQSLTRAQPFRPFRLTLVNGEEYDVHHPDMILATSGMAMMARPTPPGVEHEDGSVVFISLPLIQKVEHLTPQAVPPQNRSTV